jgi:fatty acid desaturase
MARDYSLTEESQRRVAAAGLAGAAWYKPPLSRAELKALVERKDGPALRDTAIWVALLILSGVGGYLTWGSWWAVPCFAVYGVLYGGATDSRWHECGHRTAFKTVWMNDALYEVACFMVLREPTVWRWSHTRHHTDTLIVGRDPEISVPRPPDIAGILLNILALKSGVLAFRSSILHATGRLTEAERTFIPESEQKKVYRTARICLAIYAAVIALAIGTGSILPLMYVGLPSFYGAWFVILVGLTQHAGLGLAEDVLDHRLNTRTVYMNPVFRFLYWNMNYHVEHHIFPMVPYHALPKLHALVKNDLPPPYPNILSAYREIVPALRRQMKDPAYHVVRPLPAHVAAAATAAE